MRPHRRQKERGPSDCWLHGSSDLRIWDLQPVEGVNPRGRRECKGIKRDEIVAEGRFETARHKACLRKSDGLPHDSRKSHGGGSIILEGPLAGRVPDTRPTIRLI